MMRDLLWMLPFMVLGACACAATGMLDQLTTHPRLLYTAVQQRHRREQLAGDDTLRDLVAANTRNAEAILEQAPVQYLIPDGKRLLRESRKCLYYTTTLAMAYRWTGDRRFRDRAVEEMLTAARFKDWNPSHFLDTAEMTAALAIGYDWLFDNLRADERQAIEVAILELGLKPGMHCYEHNAWWVTRDNNWNQVCNGGMILGALAVADVYPDTGAKILDLALKSIPAGTGVYAPDGAYPEGPGYWNYGTSYTVMTMSALKTATGSEHGVGDAPGFSKTAAYWVNMLSPSGRFFNYADGGATYRPTPATFYLATRFADPALAWWHRRQLAAWLARGKGTPERFFALEIAWYTDIGNAADARDWPTGVKFRGVQDVALMRSTWGDPDAWFLGIKGGNNRASHGHLDIGSFVLDVDGVRWAEDLGSDDYNMPGYFGGKRWSYYRLNNRSHNTLVIGDQLQDPRAVSRIIHFADDEAGAQVVVDMSPAYAGQVQKASRRALFAGDEVVIQDLLVGATNDVRWGMMTHADVELQGRKAILRRSGKTLIAELVDPGDVRFETVSTRPPTERERQNEGTTMLAVTLKAGAGTVPHKLTVRFRREKATPSGERLPPWPAPGRVQGP